MEGDITTSGPAAKRSPSIKNIHEDETNKQAKKADKVHRTLFAMMTMKFRPA